MVENYRGDMESMGGTTSVKVHHAPGGATSINLFGGYGDDDNKTKTTQKPGGAVGAAQSKPEEEKMEEAPEQLAAGQKAPEKGAAAGGNAGGANLTHVIGGAAPLTSVKYSGQPPGGKSSGPLW